MKFTSETLDLLEDRLKAADKLVTQYKGDSDGLSVELIGNYVVVDDGQDKWVTTLDEYQEHVEEVVKAIGNGRWDQYFDNEEWIDLDALAYDELCKCRAIYSVNGPETIEDFDEIDESVRDVVLAFFGRVREYENRNDIRKAAESTE